MKPWKCPNCGARAGVPVVYGLPSRGAVDAAERGDLVLGGCVLTDDDPPRCCTECRAALWPGGIFAIPGAAGDLRTRLAGGRSGRHLEVSVAPDWTLTIAWKGGKRREADLVVAPRDVDHLLILMAAEVLTDGPTLLRWLHKHGLGFVGILDGPVDRCSISDDGMVSFGGANGGILVHSSVERLLLQLTQATYRRQGFRSIVEMDGWLADSGLEILRMT